MYATLDIIKSSKYSGKIVGVHQKIDGISRKILSRHLRNNANFPGEKQILYFEGTRGPDGLKRKSPGKDEPHSFLNPEDNDGKLWQNIENHHHNLSVALEEGDKVRSAFEASWLAHFIVDGLTPAHHYPFEEVVDQLMSEKDYHELFGTKLKGVMRGNNISEVLINNWSYIGAGGVMTKHVAYELAVAYLIALIPSRRLTPKIKLEDLRDIDFKKEFYSDLHAIYKKDYYHHFLQEGWDNYLMEETVHFLIPTMIHAVTLGWASALPPERLKEIKK